MRIVPVRYRLPVSYSTEIGRFITRWAYLEWLLKETAYTLLKMNPKIGRIALQEPRVHDYLTMLEDLAQLRGVTVSFSWSKLRQAVKPLEAFRNKLVHGVWVKEPSSKYPALRQVKGSYVPKPGAKSVDARIKPAAMPVPLGELKNAVAGINRANQIMHEIKDEIEAQLTP